ncbi:ER membrane glycoprotein subunit of the GPI transamidase complex-like protein [Ascochyta rabiei]|uniref:ER membrane glycoprotein subunit of the GPI transamidase complex-like protein n=1 Tax=Didymella rabiei TaxID=5454 RepID=UPI001902C0A4|nr:ER membrane glycoprotein subunit of the GPI transamidase complex-like protein [Ascochyta rabiei]UPX15343.1 ER membrane glycoprotein subunit of the GPI transamidase complex-like protein [Ascochyta rabiei]
MAAPKASGSRRLVLVFCTWKTLLFLLTAFCPGPGYDTSALILTDASTHRYANLESSSRLDHLVLNLFRWDALYFVKAAERGLMFEQQWAFSPAFSQLLSVTTRFVFGTSEGSLWYYITTGIIVSTVCHCFSVLVLYKLLTLLTGAGRQQSRVPFVASVLHIFTPASLFLSSPYAEALFSLLNLTGMLCYAESRAAANRASINTREVAHKLGSGLLFAMATAIRSNGLLSGLILLYDVARYLPQLFSMRIKVQDVCRVIVTCASGALIAIGFVGPQYLAYLDFCGTGNSTVRPWCKKSIPSIYSWVQSHYWNVGLFRYWTMSNLPLFLLALPMLWLLVYSSVTTLRSGYAQPLHGRPTVPHASDTLESKHAPLVTCELPELALPQLVLAFAAATSFHVQIINRIASGYPIWYLTVAVWLVEDRSNKGQWATRAMIMYSMIQGMLFANFLPPA